MYVVDKPCNIYRFQGKPHDNYRISPQSENITGFPHSRENLRRPRNALLTSAVCTVSVNLAEFKPKKLNWSVMTNYKFITQIIIDKAGCFSDRNS